MEGSTVAEVLDGTVVKAHMSNSSPGTSGFGAGSYCACMVRMHAISSSWSQRQWRVNEHSGETHQDGSCCGVACRPVKGMFLKRRYRDRW